jgi:hypothetical protein
MEMEKVKEILKLSCQAGLSQWNVAAATRFIREKRLLQRSLPVYGKKSGYKGHIKHHRGVLPGERIACHVRSYGTRRRYITCDTHMPEKHRAVTDWSPQRFISWAAKTGEKTKAYITWLLEHRDHPEQAYKTCAGILRLASGVLVEQMEHACSRALARNISVYRYFKTLLLSAGDLRLPVMAAKLREQQELPDIAALSFEERLGFLVEAEWLSRRSKRINRLIIHADFRFTSCCLEDIDYQVVIHKV